LSGVAHSGSGLPPHAVHGPVAGFGPRAEPGAPGALPATRRVYPAARTGRPRTVRQHAGFGAAKGSSERCHDLVRNGTGGLSVASGLPARTAGALRDVRAACRPRDGFQPAALREKGYLCHEYRGLC
jgi:methylmalonyl-CoA mutase N-terminal domain/subunit